jgi:AcrR family transcriptional regulator
MARPRHGPQDIARRRQHWVDTARALFADTRSLPSVEQVAVAAGVAKGSLYGVFSTKEHLYTELLAQEFAGFFERLARVVIAMPALAEEVPRRFAVGFARAVGHHGLLLPLAALTNAVFEKNLPTAAYVAFKQALSAHVVALARLARDRVPVLSQRDAERLLLATWSLTVGLWQALDYPAEVRALLEREKLNLVRWRFRTELPHAVERLWRGAMVG